MKNKEVFIAKNGRPYVKDDNGKVKFISNTDWEQYKTTKEDRNNMKWLLGVVGLFTIFYITFNAGWL